MVVLLRGSIEMFMLYLCILRCVWGIVLGFGIKRAEARAKASWYCWKAGKIWFWCSVFFNFEFVKDILNNVFGNNFFGVLGSWWVYNWAS